MKAGRLVERKQGYGRPQVLQAGDKATITKILKKRLGACVADAVEALAIVTNLFA